MLQMLLLGLFISSFKQLYFGLAPSQALSAGITARCTGTLPRCTRGWSRPIWKSKCSFESLPARWKHCQSLNLNLEAEQSPSGHRERCQLVAPGVPLLPPERGASGQAGAVATAAPGRGGTAEQLPCSWTRV